MQLPVFVRNKVVRGFGRGSKELGCPTANVDAINHLNIQTGIYCGLVQLIVSNSKEIQEEPGKRDVYEAVKNSLPYVSPIHGMVCSFGFNPQYANKDKSLEVHILDKLEFNFYGAELRVLICKKMRDERSFNSLEELKVAIANDIHRAENEVINFRGFAGDNEYFINTDKVYIEPIVR